MYCKEIKVFYRFFHRREAFTFIEIIIVMVILLTMAAVVIPNFAGTFRFYQLHNFSKNMSHQMRYAQSRAITKNVFLKMVINEQGRFYQLLEGEYGDGLPESVSYHKIHNRFGRKFLFPEEIEVKTNNNEVLFYPDGEIDKVRVDICQGVVCKWLSTQEQRGHLWVLDYKRE